MLIGHVRRIIRLAICVGIIKVNLLEIFIYIIMFILMMSVFY